MSSRADPALSLGRFQLLDEIGRGGMGRVVAARDPRLERTVAVKLLIDPRRTSPEQLERFVSEARITSQLEHPGVVPVYEGGSTASGELFFVMRKVQGVTLQEALARPEQWSGRRLLTAFVQVCRTVAFAHDRGVLHRDLKPENVMLGDFGEVLVLDWGIALRLGGTDPEGPAGAPVPALTMEGASIGTPGWMSPEQARGERAELDGRSDVFSLGAMLFALLTGEPPYAGGTAPELLYKTVTVPIDDPRERSPERSIEPALAELCVRALAIDRDARVASATRLAEAVERILEGSERRAEADVLVGQARGHPADTEEGRRAVLVLLERALFRDPEHREARTMLAELNRDWVVEAEARGDRRAASYFVERLRAVDDGTHAGFLQGTGRLFINSDPPSQVFCARVRRRGRVWDEDAAVELGHTPLDISIGRGSYVLTLRAGARPSVRVPVLMPRQGEVRHRTLPLVDPGDEVYVPAGTFRCGGDDGADDALPAAEPYVDGFLMARFPVTVGEYVAFLNALCEAGRADEAWGRVPRQVGSRGGGAGQYWPRADGAYSDRIVDRDGDAWDPRWPVSGVSWEDAMAYAAWRARRDGLPWTLPTELQWEKAARGVDGRRHPWGDRLDPQLCKTERSRPGRSVPEPVGTFPTDVSVYGVRDLGGGVREWCLDTTFVPDGEGRALRGGSWARPPRCSRAADRETRLPWVVDTAYGFRLVRPLPEAR